MNITIKHRSREAGIVLLTSLLIMGFVCITLLSIFCLVDNQRLTQSKDNSWNRIIPICEAGIDDAMAHINYGGTGQLGSDGWTYSGSNYSRTLHLGNDYCVTTISTDSVPVITSSGYAQIPLSSDKANSNYVSRTIQITTQPQNGPFPNAVLLKGSFSAGTGDSMDSFNSSDPNYSTNGLYDCSKRKSTAHLQTMSTSDEAVYLSHSFKIYGYVDTPPGTGVIVDGNQGGAVGDANWINTQEGLEPGHNSTTLNTIIPDVSAPSLANTMTLTPNPSYYYNSPPQYVIDGQTYLFAINGGNYTIDNLMVNRNYKMYVGGNCTLYVPGNFNVDDNGQIYLAPGARLKLYVGGQISLGGAGLVNATGNAANCSILGLPTCTADVSFDGSAQFIGTFYVPDAKFNLAGGSDICGAIVANSMVVTGSGKLHYDEALGTSGANGNSGASIQVASWHEL